MVRLSSEDGKAGAKDQDCLLEEPGVELRPPATCQQSLSDGVVHVRPLVCLVCRVGACEQQVVRHRQSLVMEAARAPSTTGLLELPAGSVSKIQDREECRPVTLECQINMEGVL